MILFLKHGIRATKYETNSNSKVRNGPPPNFLNRHSKKEFAKAACHSHFGFESVSHFAFDMALPSQGVERDSSTFDVQCKLFFQFFDGFERANVAKSSDKVNLERLPIQRSFETDQVRFDL